MSGTGRFLPPSNAWRYYYETWYLFDPDRVPDNRKRNLYLGHTRLGIHKYSAEAMIRIRTPMPRYFLRVGGYVHGFFRPANTEAIERVRRGVRASMATRDTVLIDTNVTRTIQVRDLIDASGRYTVGQSIEN